MTKPRILLVDDDLDVADFARSTLEPEGFEVLHAKDLFQARGLLSRGSVDLVLLDRRLPDGDGLDLCRELRADPRISATPVLFLSSKKSVSDKVSGLSVGGDDYLPKPFDGSELTARVRALLRRTATAAAPARVLRSGEFEVDLSGRTARAAGKSVELTSKEFDLLHAFLECRGRVLSRAFLLERVWGIDRAAEVESRVVDVTVSSLRRKLGAAGARIVSVIGHGYRLDEPAST